MHIYVNFIDTFPELKGYMEFANHIYTTAEDAGFVEISLQRAALHFDKHVTIRKLLISSSVIISCPDA